MELFCVEAVKFYLQPEIALMQLPTAVNGYASHHNRSMLSTLYSISIYFPYLFSLVIVII